MEGNIFVKHHDTEDKHFTISYDSARLDAYNDWSLEKSRSKAAYNAYYNTKDMVNPMPNPAPVLTSPIDENKRLLERQKEEMRGWLRAGNRW
ncbi:MAG: hypothetical protein V1906_02725 [Candidatus Woesearchaeota archaeon]